MKKEPLPCKQRYPYHCIRCHAFGWSCAEGCRPY